MGSRSRQRRGCAAGLLLLYYSVLMIVRQSDAFRDLRTVGDIRQLGGTPVGLDENGRQSNGTGGLVFALKRRDGHIRGHTARGMLANGTLPLHGAVKDLGYFYAELKLGTPAKRFAVIVDTGSTMTYVPCSYCTPVDCGQNKMNPSFNPEASSTFEQIKCRGDSRCQCGSPACGCSKNKCSYTRYYAESSTSAGHMVSDMMHLSDKEAVRVTFGCETKETGEIYHQAADGLMGLGSSDVSIPNQLAKSGAIEPVFSLCFGDMQGSGALMIGNVPLASELRIRHVPLVHNSRHPHYYNINLHALSIGPDKLKVPENEWTKGYGTVLDSGTTFSYIPREAFSALKSAVSKHAALKGLNKVPGPDPKYVDECWGGAPENPNELPRVFPSMTLHLDEGFDLELLPINYLFIHTHRPGAYCLGLFDNGSSGTLLGGITFRNVLVQYDKREGKNRVGLAHAPCKLLGSAVHQLHHLPLIV
uniref:Peptidase A1 domain-containing protein n=1 Tax=Tetraselmis chuii TaxID=63592 RepID=A0A7S1WZC5_9CHLO|mmetsp:Transcript_15908/g.28246  ORF Transcript_15908/g.28246 Transcript_15908/m.28246 type:complete len:474 (+) Transcript_15908:100-1521(+)